MSETFNHWIRDLEDFKDAYTNFDEPMKKFDNKEWEAKEDESHIQWLMKNCVKGCTKESISREDAECYYNGCVKNEILYHYPEDSETLHHYINAYNFLNKWK